MVEAECLVEKSGPMRSLKSAADASERVDTRPVVYIPEPIRFPSFTSSLRRLILFAGEVPRRNITPRFLDFALVAHAHVQMHIGARESPAH